MNKQIFPIFHPVSKEFLFHKERYLVHKHGDWHKGLQANIIRKNNKGSFDILLQFRSNTVDIGKLKFDQSLAVQMLDIDNLNELNTLQRGLSSELGIILFKSKKIDLDLRIIKTYKDDQEKLNRELLTLFLITVNDSDKIAISSKKVKTIRWMEWYQFLEFFHRNKERFTKTSRFYFETEEICEYIRQKSYLFLNIKNQSHKKFLSNKIFLHINKEDDFKKTYVVESKNSSMLKEYLELYE